MADEERAPGADELMSRWLTVGEVLGRRAGLRAGVHRGLEMVSAGEYPPAAVPADENQDSVPRLVATATASAALVDEYPHPAPRLVAVAGAAPAAGYPPPDLVAADTALASRWFTADPAPGKLAGRTVVLPFVALAELATWPERLLWGHSRAEDLSRWTDPDRVLGGDDTVCRIWARITVAAQRAGRAPSSDEAWIAAGCLSYGLPLATLTKRRYQYFADRFGLRLL
ncbi:putative nucleic acid-binding protein [Catenulispora sp. GP43]|uniref:hypothetical protein n=1 Tax=Catenulispora sp. GP43 TaxID=3156263 RepID=UPI0035167EC0